MSMGVLDSSIERAKRVIAKVAEGQSLKRALIEEGLSAVTFNAARSSVRELNVSYLQAREIQSDLAVDEAVEIADDSSIDPQQARNMIDIRKWRASKLHSRVYGDRIEVNMQQTISIADTLADARARLVLPDRYQLPTLDAQVIEETSSSSDGASDCQSEGRQLPDIFR